MATPPKKPSAKNVTPAKLKPAAKPVAQKAAPAELKPLAVTAKAEPAPAEAAPFIALAPASETAVARVAEPGLADSVIAAAEYVAAADIEAPETKDEVEETDTLKYVAAPKPAAPEIAEGKKTMTEAFETGKKFANEAKEKLTAAYAELNAKTKAAVEKSGKLVEEVNELTRGNVEAVVESSKIAVKGIEVLGQDAADYGRRQFENTSATIKSFAAAKTPAELFQLQSNLWASYFDSIATETAKRSETVLKLAGDIAQPISTRFAVVSDKVKTLATPSNAASVNTVA